MKCPGCGSRVFVDVGIQGAQDLLVEVVSGKYHDSARCHAADPVRYWAKFILDNEDKFIEHDPDGVKKRTLAALRAALEV